jgi:hypothetical protein
MARTIEKIGRRMAPHRDQNARGRLWRDRAHDLPPNRLQAGRAAPLRVWFSIDDGWKRGEILSAPPDPTSG